MCKLLKIYFKAAAHYFRQGWPGRLTRDRKAGIAMIVAVSTTPMLAGMGMAIDTARLVSYHQLLQSIVDSAALAGAARYSESSQSQIASTTATISVGGRSLPSGLTLSTPVVSTSFDATAYKVTISINATMTTTFLGMVGYRSLPISATAAAINPILTPQFTFGHFGSTASDANYVAWYTIPSNSDGTSNWAYQAKLSEMTEIADNCNTDTNAGNTAAQWSSGSICNQMSSSIPSGTKQSLSTTQPIAFSLVNITYALHDTSFSANSSNSYGSYMSHTNIFYSGLEKANKAPSDYANGSYTLNATYNGVTYNNSGTVNYPAQNCSFTIRKLSSGESQTTKSDAYDNKCFDPTSTTTGGDLAALSCAKIGGDTYMIQWNDMGGNPDDKDYDDAYFTINCSIGPSASGERFVTLVK